MIRLVALLLGLVVAFAAPPSCAQTRGPLVLAAASLQESLTEAAGRWAAKGHPKPVLSFAASSALARQIAAGAPADLFIPADEQWMDEIERKGFVRARTRSSFLTNRLVLISPASSATRLTVRRGFPLARSLGRGRLAVADTQAVPAGRYAKAALMHFGVWGQVARKLAQGDSVRSALALVERGEAPFGIVYATDARASKGVRVVGTFPAASHPPITYPVALLRQSTHRDADGFRRFLLSREGRAIFARYGFLARQGSNK